MVPLVRHHDRKGCRDIPTPLPLPPPCFPFHHLHESCGCPSPSGTIRCTPRPAQIAKKKHFPFEGQCVPGANFNLSYLMRLGSTVMRRSFGCAQLNSLLARLNAPSSVARFRSHLCYSIDTRTREKVIILFVN